MTIENLVNIIGGIIINKPKVTKVDAATIYQSKVEMGDLFFAVSKEDIAKAVEKGAYAIVFEEDDIQITDSEVAYIKVGSVKSATIKFLRYILVQKESKIYYFENVEVSLLKQISFRKNSNYAILSQNWQKNFELILNSDFEIYITTKQDEANSLSPNYKIQNSLANGYIISDSLLKTTFKIDKYIYQNAEMPPFFLDNLRKVVAFCQKFSIDFDLNRIKYTDEFKPFFVDYKLNIAPKGSTDKVLIFVKDTKTIDKSIEYLRHQGKWLKSIILTPAKTKLESVNKTTWYKNVNEAKEILKKEHFHYAFCYKLEPQEVIKYDNQEYSSLFNN